jgi:hypothetical protein
MQIMQINLTNRIPKGLEWELVSGNEPIFKLLKEEGIERMVQGLYHKARELDPDEMIWEGYWVDQKNSTTNLCIVGVLRHRGMYFTRVIRVKQVPAAQREETEKALTDMIAEYLEGLLVELERTVPPGRGKGSLNGH